MLRRERVGAALVQLLDGDQPLGIALVQFLAELVGQVPRLGQVGGGAGGA
jgi:hypothetical protein